MMPDMVRLAELRAADAATAGAKAANLGELIAAGMAVPPGFCVPTSVYDRVVKPILAPYLARFTPASSAGEEATARMLREAVEAIAWPPPLRAELERAYADISADACCVAVRSSGTSEDTAAASFAGQYHTALGLCSFGDVVTAVTRCWASLWQAHAIRYRERANIPHAEASMAVIVQAMVPAESAGVMFVTAASPENSGSVVIESSWGLGEAVVSGIVTPDRFVVSWAEQRVTSAELARKSRMIAPVSEGTTMQDVAPERQHAASITHEQAVELGRLGSSIVAHFGSSQDVEWAIADGQVTILQARPLTRELTTPAGVRWESPVEGAEWARISICDSWLAEPLSPLFATTLFPRMVGKWKQNWTGRDLRVGQLLPDPMAGTINGYAYIRLDNQLNRHPVLTGKLVFSFFRFHLSRLERHWRTSLLPHHVERVSGLSALDLHELGTEDLLRVIDEAEELSGTYWAILGGLAWYWNSGEWLLGRLYPYLVKPTAQPAGFEVLLRGYPTKSSEIDDALYEIACSDRQETETQDGFDRFLARYANQAYHLDFIEPTPAEDPSAFLTTLGAYRAGRSPDPHERLRSLARQRDEVWAHIEAGLRRAPVRRAVLQGLLRWNRRYGQVRDEALHYFTMAWPTIRRGYRELGRRLVEAGALREDTDVFYLTGDELLAELRTVGQGDRPRDWDEAVRQRRVLREKQMQLIPPKQVPGGMRVEVAGVDFLPLAFLGRHDDSDDQCGDAPSLRGFAVSPGRVTATARHIASARDFGKLEAGDVMVATYVSPAWSPLLGIAGAIVTDAGGALSHGSIVAREYGIPAVMGTGNATKVIRDGQTVTVDGTRGVVYLAERSAF